MNSFDIFLQFFIYIIIIINLFIIIQISLSRIFKLEKNISLVTEYKFLRNVRLRIISEMSEYVRRKEEDLLSLLPFSNQEEEEEEEDRSDIFGVQSSRGRARSLQLYQPPISNLDRERITIVQSDRSLIFL